VRHFAKLHTAFDPLISVLAGKKNSRVIFKAFILTTTIVVLLTEAKILSI